MHGIWACSGPPEVVGRLIREAQAHARLHLLVYVGIALFVLFTHVQSPARLKLLGILALPLLFHPYWWDRGASGDCGGTLRQGALTLTVYASLVGIGAFVWDYCAVRTRLNSR